MQRLRFLLIVLVAMMLGALVALLALPDARERLFGGGSPVQYVGAVQVGGPFALTDHTGKRVSDQDFRGRLMLVFFGFTYCPDVCPGGLQVMTEALEKLGPKADKIVPILISIDPERDTPKVLSEYVKAFHPRLVGLTGTPEEIAAVAKAYRVYFKKVEQPTSQGGYTVDHSTLFYLMDGNGKYLAHLPSTASVQTMIERLGRLL